MLTDFLIGFFVVNALPHYLFGRMKVGVLSLFGYSPAGNLCYACLCLAAAGTLFSYKHGLGSLGEHMILCGALFVVICYVLIWDIICRFLRRDLKEPEELGPL